MKLTDVGLDNIEDYIADPKWVMQQKMDGIFLMAVLDSDGWLFTQDGEHKIKSTAALQFLPVLEQELNQIAAEMEVTNMTLIGELMVVGPERGRFWVFDLLDVAHEHIQYANAATMPWLARQAWMQGYLHLSVHVRKLPVAITEEQKHTLWDLIVTKGVEGAVSKHVDSIYEPGVRSKQWVKHKLVKTADVVVMAIENWTARTGSAAIGVYVDSPAGPILKQIGNTSLIGKNRAIKVGSVVEIRYLNWGGSSPVQPAILRLRTDKPAKSCDMEQFPEYSREVVA
jgi:hypothetical protein